MSPDWLRVDLALVGQVGLEAALVHSLIEFRSHGDDGWTTTRDKMAEALHLSEYRVKTALVALRDAALVTAVRADRFRPTLTWRVVCPGITEKSDIAVTRSSQTPSPVKADIAVSSYEEVQEPLVVVGTSPQAAPKASRRKPQTTYPEGFTPTAAHRAKAQELGVDLTIEGPKFQHYHQAKGSRYSDWGAALHLWIRNAAQFASERSNVTPMWPSTAPVEVPAYNPGVFG